MSKIAEKYLRFTPTEGDGADSYLVYAIPEGMDFDYDDPNHLDVDLQTEDIPLSELITEEGDYDIYVVSQDAYGNMSDEVLIVDAFPFDFTPPLPIVGGEIYQQGGEIY